MVHFHIYSTSKTNYIDLKTHILADIHIFITFVKKYNLKIRWENTIYSLVIVEMILS